jgi:hypothetical protein
LRTLLILFAAAYLVSGEARAAECFTASKVYQIHPIHAGRNSKDGWSVQGDEFAQCVKRAEVADKVFRGRYPDSVYELSLTATIGCHAPCSEN